MQEEIQAFCRCCEITLTKVIQPANYMSTQLDQFNTNIVLLWVADFDKEQMIKQPIDRFVTVKHQNKLHNERQVVRLEQFT